MAARVKANRPPKLDVGEGAAPEGEAPATVLVPYRDASGRRQWVEMSGSEAYQLDLFERNMRNRDAIYRKHHRHQSDRESQPRRRAAKHRYALVGYLNFELESMVRELIKRPDGTPWVGPRPDFTLRLGESAVWGGPGSMFAWVVDTPRGPQAVWTGETLKGLPVEFEPLIPHLRRVCRFCFHLAKMSRETCCLGCDRTGEG